jgi:hypothetical protein
MVQHVDLVPVGAASVAHLEALTFVIPLVSPLMQSKDAP